MEKECKYKSTCNVSKVLIVAILSFAMVCAIMLFIMLHYHKKVNRNFQHYISRTSEILSDIKVEKQKNQQIIISEDLAKAISKVNQNEYDNFLHSYYEIQNNWLNIWLTILALILGLFGLVLPLCFLKFYETKKEEFNIVIREVEETKKTMTQDIKETKEYVEKAKESEKRVNASRLYISSLQECSSKNYLEALKLINQALDLDSKNIVFLLCKADILRELDQHGEAVKLYEQVIANEPSIAAYNNYGHSLKKLNRKKESIEAYTSAINLSQKDDYRLFCNRGIARMETGDMTLALTDFNKALSCIPDKESASVIFYNITECYLKYKNFPEALFYLKQYMASTKTAYIYDDDKDKWLDYLKNNLDQKEAFEIETLISTLPIKKRHEN